ncbi:class F sortase [Nocardioides sp.]|uniref:class F sortase n=1 Tax=Nocardioides sp. TaxID=35761 RepID=UPI003D0AAC6E
MTTDRAPAIVAFLAVVGLAVSAVALWPRSGSADPSVGGPDPGPPQPSVTATPAPVGAPVTRAPAKPPLPESPAPRPREIRIAAIGLDAPLVATGVGADGQMALPPDPKTLGWYEFGLAPGSTEGSAVIAGHLDSYDYGLGPLVGLRELEPGDGVEVSLANGRTVRYVVSSLRRFDREALPASLFSRSGPPTLRIITCGGPYDRAAGGYQQNLVVTAVPA